MEFDLCMTAIDAHLPMGYYQYVPMIPIAYVLRSQGQLHRLHQAEFLNSLSIQETILGSAHFQYSVYPGMCLLC